MTTTDLTLFDFRGSRVRVVLINGEPWFVAADACFVLGYRNSRDAVAKHVRSSQRGVSRIATPSGDQDMTVISEGGLYRLIMRANTVLVDEFQDWVTDEVLPTIRKTGSYGNQLEPVDTKDNLVASVTRRELAAMVIAEADRADAAEAKVAELEPAANSWTQLAEASGDYSLREAAQILDRDPSISTGQNRLARYLREIGWTDRSGEPYQRHVDVGRLVRRPRSYDHPLTGESIATSQVRVTVRGVHELHRLLGGTGPVLLEVA